MFGIGSARDLGGTREMEATHAESEMRSLAEECFERAHGDPLIALDIACLFEARWQTSDPALNSLAV